MPAKKKSLPRNSFAVFMDDTMIQLMVLVLALVALVFSILELSQIVR